MSMKKLSKFMILSIVLIENVTILSGDICRQPLKKHALTLLSEEERNEYLGLGLTFCIEEKLGRERYKKFIELNPLVEDIIYYYAISTKDQQNDPLFFKKCKENILNERKQYTIVQRCFLKFLQANIINSEKYFFKPGDVRLHNYKLIEKFKQNSFLEKKLWPVLKEFLDQKLSQENKH